MTDYKEKFDALADDLKRLRDELQLQVHLGKAEARDEWADLEGKWEQFENKMRAVGEEAGEAAKDVGTALEKLGGELKTGYERIKKAL